MKYNTTYGKYYVYEHILYGKIFWVGSGNWQRPYRFDNRSNLIWYDSLQLCPSCYERFTASPYNQRVMLLNSIKCYRKLIAKYEDNGNIQLDCNFEGIDTNLKSKDILKNQ